MKLSKKEIQMILALHVLTLKIEKMEDIINALVQRVDFFYDQRYGIKNHSKEKIIEEALLRYKKGK